MAQDDAKLFVRGLADSITESMLKQLFEETGGTVVQINVPRDRDTGRPRGIAFVSFATSEQAQAARQTLDGSFHGGRSISVRPYEATPPRRDDATGPRSSGPQSRGPASQGRPGAGPGAPDRTLYVGNLPYDCTVQEIEELIGAHAPGEFQKVHLPTDPDGRRRGFGFVTVNTSEGAKKLAETLKTADLRGRKLNVNLAQPRGERPPPRGGDFSGGGGGGFGHFAPPPPPPPAGRRFDEKKRKPGAGNFEDGGAPKKKKAKGEGHVDWRKAADDYEDE